MRRLALVLLALLAIAGLYAGWTANDAPAAAKSAAAAWGRVEDEFRSRADFSGKIAATVAQLNPGEKALPAKIAAARAAALALPPDPAAPASRARFLAFMKVQDALSEELGLVLDMLRLYPDQARSGPVRQVFDELELKESHIVVARTDFVAQANRHNRIIGDLPSRWVADLFHPEEKPLMASFDQDKG